MALPDSFLCVCEMTCIFMVKVIHPYVKSLNDLNEICNIQRTVWDVSVTVLNGDHLSLIYPENLTFWFHFISFISTLIFHLSFSNVRKYIL